MTGGVCHPTVSIALFAAVPLLSLMAASQQTKLVRYTVGPKPLISITNNHGAITVRPSGNNQIVVSTVSNSDAINFVSEQHGNRVEVRAESDRRGTSLAEYTVLVPNDSIVSLRSLDGSLSAEGLRGDVILETATARVHATSITGAHLHIKTLSGPVTLTDIRDSHLDVHSVSGNIDIHNVTGAFVEASSGSGRIIYDGDPGSAGYYRLTSHTGDLDVSIPASALVEITARSLKGESDQSPSNVDLGSHQNPDRWSLPRSPTTCRRGWDWALTASPPSRYSLFLFVTRTGEVGWNLFHWAIEDFLEDQPTVCRERGSFADVSRQKLGQSCINSRNRLSIRSGPGC